MTTPVRLAKRLVELSACSRREAELYIAGGWVSVDSVVVEEPQFMVSQQRVELHPEATLTPIEPVTMVFHQPPATESGGEVVTPTLSAETRTADDPSDIHLLKQHFFRLTQCTPLEQGAYGLLVYTQDWRVTRKLKDDAAIMEQEYVVEVEGTLSAEGLKLLNHGLTFNGISLKPIKVSWQNERHLRFAIKGVVPGQIKHGRPASPLHETLTHRSRGDVQIAVRAMALFDAA
jgi:23S rRNA pseudouridine2604 synthase